jgi:hypothetical protein
MPNYAPIPEFGQLVEYITQGPLVGDTYGVVINRVKLEAIIKPPEMEGIPAGDNLPSLQSIKTDYTKVNAINPVRVPILTPSELTPVKTVIAIDHHSDVVKYATDTTPTGLVITTKLVEVIQRPALRNLVKEKVIAMGLDVADEAWTDFIALVPPPFEVTVRDV